MLGTFSNTKILLAGSPIGETPPGPVSSPRQMILVDKRAARSGGRAVAADKHVTAASDSHANLSKRTSPDLETIKDYPNQKIPAQFAQ